MYSPLRVSCLSLCACVHMRVGIRTFQVERKNSEVRMCQQEEDEEDEVREIMRRRIHDTRPSKPVCLSLYSFFYT